MSEQPPSADEPSPEWSQKDVADDAVQGIKNLWENPSELGSSDPVYQDARGWLYDLRMQYAHALFNMARETQGKERARYARALERMLILLGVETENEILSSLMTTRDAVLELRAMADREQGKTKKKSGLKNIFSSIFKK